MMALLNGGSDRVGLGFADDSYFGISPEARDPCVRFNALIPIPFQYDIHSILFIEEKLSSINALLKWETNKAWPLGRLNLDEKH